MPDYLVCTERLLAAHQITYTHKPTVDNSRSRFSMFNIYVSTSLIMFVSVCLSAYLTLWTVGDVNAAYTTSL